MGVKWVLKGIAGHLPENGNFVLRYAFCPPATGTNQPVPLQQNL
jgi:hypothetical protein